MRVWGHGMASHGTPEGADAVLVDRALSLYGVASAAGSHRRRGVAAVAALQVMQESLAARRDVLERAKRGKTPARALCRALEDATEDAHRELRRMASGRTHADEVSATVIWAIGPAAILSHAGDSRCYRLRRGALELLSADQTVARALSEGRTLPPSSGHGLSAGDLINALGRRAGFEPNVAELRLEHGDRFLLCTRDLARRLYDMCAFTDALGAGVVCSLPESLVQFATSSGAASAAAVVLQAEDETSGSLPSWPLWLHAAASPRAASP